MRKTSKSIAAARRAAAKRQFTLKSRRSFNSRVKQIVMRNSETKMKVFSTSYNCVALNICLHNANTVIPIWKEATTSIWPTGGTSDAGRIGENINSLGVLVRAVFQIPHDRRNMRFKMYFVQYNSIQGDPGTTSDFYHWTLGNTMIDSVDKDTFPNVQYLGTYKCRAVDQTTGTQDKTILVKKWIPLKKRLTFKGTIGAPMNLKENGVLVIAPYDSVDTLATDIPISKIEIACSLYYKDL